MKQAKATPDGLARAIIDRLRTISETDPDPTRRERAQVLYTELANAEILEIFRRMRELSQSIRRVQLAKERGQAFTWIRALAADVYTEAAAIVRRVRLNYRAIRAGGELGVDFPEARVHRG